MLEIKDIDEFIAKERTEIRVYVIFSVIILFVGVFLLIKGSENKDTAELVKIGGGLITTIVGVPISRVLYIRKRVFVFKLVKRKLSFEMSEDDKKKLEEALWKNISSIIENGNVWFNYGNK